MKLDKTLVKKIRKGIIKGTSCLALGLFVTCNSVSCATQFINGALEKDKNMRDAYYNMNSPFNECIKCDCPSPIGEKLNEKLEGYYSWNNGECCKPTYRTWTWAGRNLGYGLSKIAQLIKDY